MLMTVCWVKKDSFRAEQLDLVLKRIELSLEGVTFSGKYPSIVFSAEK